MVKVVVINGYPNAGKDTFVQYCINAIKDNKTMVFNYHSSEWAKNALSNIGYNEENKNDPRVRNLLAYMVEMGNELWDASIKQAEKRIKMAQQYTLKNGQDVIFIHERKPKQIQRLVERFNAGTLLIERKTANAGTNEADSNVDQYAYDWYIYNNGTLEDLRSTAHEFMKDIVPKIKEVTL